MGYVAAAIAVLAAIGIALFISVRAYRWRNYSVSDEIITIIILLCVAVIFVLNEIYIFPLFEK